MAKKELTSTENNSIIPQLAPSEDDIKNRIYTIRGVQVMLDRDLAPLYQVETKRINEAVKRNPIRFPEDFYFQLTTEEFECLKSHFATSNTSTISGTYEVSDPSRSQNATSNNGDNPLKIQSGTSKTGRGGTRYLPYVFTEEGIGQLSAVLKSETAALVSVRIQRAFVAMRKYIMANAAIFQRLDSLEQFRIESRSKMQEVDKRFEDILDRMDDGSLRHKLGMFFDGQMFESYTLVEELVKRAHQRVVLIPSTSSGQAQLVTNGIHIYTQTC